MLKTLIAGSSEKGVAEALGVSQPTVNSYVHGRIKLSTDRIWQIARLAGKNPSELIDYGIMIPLDAKTETIREFLRGIGIRAELVDVIAAAPTRWRSETINAMNNRNANLSPEEWRRALDEWDQIPRTERPSEIATAAARRTEPPSPARESSGRHRKRPRAG